MDRYWNITKNKIRKLKNFDFFNFNFLYSFIEESE